MAKSDHLENRCPDDATIDVTYNTLCGNTVRIADKARGSQYLGDTLRTGPCTIP